MCAGLFPSRFKGMSLDISKLQNVRIRGQKRTAQCPACAESGGDNKGEHLIINPEGHFGCVVYAGNGPDAKQHRLRIFELCGDRTIRPLVVIRRATEKVSLGRSGRLFRSHLKDAPIKIGLLGRLGRAFGTHAHRHSEIEPSPPLIAQHNDIRSGVPSVLGELRPNRPLTEQELLLLRRAGAENDPLIITALNLFNATIVELSRKRAGKPQQLELNLWTRRSTR